MTSRSLYNDLLGFFFQLWPDKTLVKSSHHDWLQRAMSHHFSGDHGHGVIRRDVP